MIATVAEEPVCPASTEEATPYADRICGGVYPHGAYGSGFGKPPSYGGSVVSSFSAQNAEHGGALRKPAGCPEFGSAAMCFGCNSSSDWSTPTTPDTAPAIDAGTVSCVSGARSCMPCTR